MGKSTFMKGIGKTYVMVITTVGVALAVGRGGYEIGKDMAEKVSDAEKLNLHQSNLQLNQRVRLLEDSLLTLAAANQPESFDSEGNNLQAIAAGNPNQYEHFQGNIRFGNSFLDSKTNASLSILSANSDNTGAAFISLPDKKTSNKRSKPTEVAPGQQWEFEHDGKEYLLILESIQWIGSEFSARVREK